MRVILFLLGSIFCFGCGEYFSKLYAATGRWADIVVLCYVGGVCLWLPAINETKTLAILGTLWNLGALLVTIFVGAVIFEESLTQRQSIGVLLALVSCYLLS